MQQLTLEQIQHEELLILKSFKLFCEENDLHYSLVGGTLLGAIRHKGFIPWDDDIDVCMSRPDFNRFVNLFPEFEKQTGFKMIWYADDNVSQLFLKIVNPRVIAHDAANKRTGHDYLWIDVFPYDGLPDSKQAIDETYEKASSLRSIVWLSQTKWTYGDSFLKKIGKCIIGPLVKISSSDKSCARKLCDLAKRIPYESATTVGCITWGMYGSGEALPKSLFEKQTKVSFNEEIFSAFSCWDMYLTGLYGDYMTPPPPGKRVAHGLRAWYVDQQ